MANYLIKRALQTIFVLFFVCTIIFLLLRAVGDPARLMVTPEATTQDLEELRHALGLDRPLFEQYIDFMAGIVKLDFGISYTYNQPTIDLLRMHLPATLELTSSSLLIAVILGILLGCISAIKQYSIFDNLATFLAVFTRSIPSFWLGIMMVLLFSVELRIVPPSGYGTFKHLLMPSIALGTSMAAVIARLTRSNMLEILSSDYIRTARAKGLKESTVLTRHALRNALLQVLTIIGLQMGHLLGGSIIIETVFAWPGVGRLLIESINVYDFPVIQATVAMIAFFFVLINLVIDILYGAIDPRIRLT